MKICRRCNEEKPLSDFYKHTQMKDGHLNICKICVKKRVKIHREENLERIQEYDRRRNSLPHRVKAREEYAQTKAGRKASSRAKRKWARTNKEARAAQVILGSAVRDGRIEKKPCQICGSTCRIHGHHEDYAYPLDVIWLCPKHHKLIHKGAFS